MSHPLSTFHFCPRCGSSEFLENDARSKRCATCGFTFYANAAASTVAVIINERSELLAVRRAMEPAKGTLDLPGGFVDPDESVHDGMRREVFEELGVADAQVGELLFSIPNRYVYSGFTVHTADLFFRVTLPAGATPHPADDAAEVLWLPLTEVDPSLFGLTSIRRGVERLLDNL